MNDPTEFNAVDTAAPAPSDNNTPNVPAWLDLEFRNGLFSWAQSRLPMLSSDSKKQKVQAMTWAIQFSTNRDGENRELDQNTITPALRRTFREIADHMPEMPSYSEFHKCYLRCLTELLPDNSRIGYRVDPEEQAELKKEQAKINKRGQEKINKVMEAARIEENRKASAEAKLRVGK